MEITHVSGQVHLEFFLIIWESIGIVKILGGLLLFKVSQRLNRYNTGVGNIVDFVQFLDYSDLLVAQFEMELAQDVE